MRVQLMGMKDNGEQKQIGYICQGDKRMMLRQNEGRKGIEIDGEAT